MLLDHAKVVLHDIVVAQVIYCKQALQTGVHVTVVRVIFKADNSVLITWQLSVFTSVTFSLSTSIFWPWILRLLLIHLFLRAPFLIDLIFFFVFLVVSLTSSSSSSNLLLPIFRLLLLCQFYFLIIIVFDDRRPPSINWVEKVEQRLGNVEIFGLCLARHPIFHQLCAYLGVVYRARMLNWRAVIASVKLGEPRLDPLVVNGVVAPKFTLISLNLLHNLSFFF